MPRRMPRRPSSGCTTRRPDGGSRGGRGSRSVAGRTAGSWSRHPTGEVGTPWGPAAWPGQAPATTTSSIGPWIPGRPRLPVTELEPADGVRQADRTHRSRRRAIGCQHGPADMERLAAEGRRERAPRVDRGELAADGADLPDERGIGPGLVGGRATDAAQHQKRVQRQRPLGRRRWSWSGGAVRREECPGRRVRADRRIVAAARPSRRINGGRTSDDRHGRIVEARHQRWLIGRSTLGARPAERRGTACGRDSGRRGSARGSPQAGRRNTYPTPRTVWMNAGCPGSSSIWERSQWTWTSTVRVSPA